MAAKELPDLQRQCRAPRHCYDNERKIPARALPTPSRGRRVPPAPDGGLYGSPGQAEPSSWRTRAQGATAMPLGRLTCVRLWPAGS